VFFPLAIFAKICLTVPTLWHNIAHDDIACTATLHDCIAGVLSSGTWH